MDERKRRRRLGLGLAALAWWAAACTTLKPYEKEFLLDPTMDDAALSPLKPELMSAASGAFEKLSQAASGPGATSCPTCGG
jgi:hypothetical protein